MTKNAIENFNLTIFVEKERGKQQKGRNQKKNCSKIRIEGINFSQKESMEIPGLPAYNTGKGPAGPVLQRSLTSRFAGRD